MSNCPIDLSFSKIHSNKRIEKAYESLGVKIVTRIIGFTLFLLGAKREDIAQYLQIPMGTFLSFLTRTDQYGLLAFGCCPHNIVNRANWGMSQILSWTRCGLL